MDLLQERIKELNGGRILDVATSTGGFLTTLGEWFRDFTEGVGIDAAADRIKTAAEKADNRLQFKVMDAEKLEFEDGCFDTVAMRHSLHHLRNVEQVLGEMMRVLKPGGLMIIGEVLQDPATDQPNSQRHLHHWWGRVDQTKGEPHFETFTRDQVIALTRPLRLTGEDVLEYYEEASEEEQAEGLAAMLRHTEEVVLKLREAGDQPELLKEGEGLVSLFREQGYTDEKIIYVVGRRDR
jgi:ubiquinone/menaquinone biosynthesis C-methylase UbiE